MDACAYLSNDIFRTVIKFGSESADAESPKETLVHTSVRHVERSNTHANVHGLTAPNLLRTSRT